MAVKPEFMAKIPPITRLGVPEFEPEAARVYESVLDALDDAGVPYLLGGALALNAHCGVWRDTKDLDIFVRPRDAERALTTLREAGFMTEMVYESWLGKAWKGDVYVDIIWRNANALFPVEDSWFLQDVSIHLFGREVPVIPLEEFLVSKMLVMGRYRYDGADMLHVLFERGEIVDWDKLARICGEHVGVMLAHMNTFRWAYPGWEEKVPREAVLKFTKLAMDAPTTLGPFRGRLMDIQSFEVDVSSWGMSDPHRMALERIFGSAEGRS